MIKARKRWLSILLTLAMLVSILLPAGSAFGATAVTFSNAVANVEKKDNQSLGWVKVTVDNAELGNVSGYVYATVELPTGVKYVAAPTSSNFSTNYVVYYHDAVEQTLDASSFKTGGEQKLTVAVPLGAGKTSVVFNFSTTNYSKVNIGTDAADNIIVKVTAKIIGTDGLQVGSDYTADLKVGQVVTKEVTASAEAPKALAEAKNEQKAAKITLTESAGGSFAVGDEVYLELPSSYFTWNVDGTAPDTSITNGSYGLTAVYVDGNGTKKLTVRIDAPSTTIADSFSITPYINVMPGAPAGDVTVTITSSSSKVKTATLVIGQVGAPTVTLSTKDTVTEDLLLAKKGQLVDEVTVKATGNISSGKSIVIAAPAGVKFSEEPSCDKSDADHITLYDDSKKCWIVTTSEADEIKITNIKVDVDETAALGDLKLSFSGDAGATGEVVVGKIVAPATATATPVNVVAGTNGQAAGDITVTETKPNSCVSGSVYLTLPSGVKFSDDFKYKINNGDEKTTSGAKGQNKVEIKLNLGGAVDTIKFYGIKYDVDSSFKGDVEVALSGPALSADYPDKTILRVVNAKAVSASYREASFVIGSTTYKVNGVEKTMDVAPYIKDGRTYMPVRYAALAAGVDEANIIWDGVKRTVTVMKGDRVVQMTIGSKTMLINGIAITMDVAPEIKDGRTMLPFRYVAQALGATVGWDEATKTVTMKVE